ncbi:hypothetical protein DL93DRAFT_2169679 [Clavulina sp. PMI_390]|nr:hypothetical protein DL93DRAFT_2169679 [Clavulina sp. PMI_390]
MMQSDTNSDPSTNLMLPDELLGEVFVLLYNAIEVERPVSVTTYLTSLALNHDLLSTFLCRSGDCRTRVRLLVSCYHSSAISTAGANAITINSSQAPQIKALEFEDDGLMSHVLVSPEASRLLELDSLSVQFDSDHWSTPIPKRFMQTRKLVLHNFTKIESLRLIMSSVHRLADLLEILKTGTSDTGASLAPRLAFLEARRPDIYLDGYCEACEPTPEDTALRLIETDSSSDEDFTLDETDGDEESPSESLSRLEELSFSGGSSGEPSDDSDSDSDTYSSTLSADDLFIARADPGLPAGIDFSCPVIPSAIYDILEPRIKSPLGWGLERLLATVYISCSLVDAESEAKYRACGINLKIIEDGPNPG